MSSASPVSRLSPRVAQAAAVAVLRYLTYLGKVGALVLQQTLIFAQNWSPRSLLGVREVKIGSMHLLLTHNSTTKASIQHSSFNHSITTVLDSSVWKV